MEFCSFVGWDQALRSPTNAEAEDGGTAQSLVPPMLKQKMVGLRKAWSHPTKLQNHPTSQTSIPLRAWQGIR